MSSKLITPKEKAIGDYKFYIRPFPAMDAAGISGDVAGFILPLLSGASPLIGVLFNGESEESVFEKDTSSFAPALVTAFSTLNGNKIKKLMNQLLLDYNNISYVAPGSSEAEPLTKDSLNEIFCTEVQDMYILAVEVIKINFGGFFKKLSNRFGGLIETLKKTGLLSTELSTPLDSLNSN